MAEAGAAAAPAEENNAVAASNEPNAAWPVPPAQLEQWMMNTVKEGDAPAKFLRSMLQMNPAYGTYLQTDEDLIAVVQQFARRIKQKVAVFEKPADMKAHTIIQPLCEMLWRVVGLVMHGVIELEEEANMPVPKEASGMIKMLLHTNTQLSNKLNELRRVYLKELAEHRDRQRRLSPAVVRALAAMEEQPIMFYEPLEFVLDDTTKDFVREVIVERMKLEMRTTAMSNDDNSEMNRYIEELEHQVEHLKIDLKTTKATVFGLEERMKTQVERVSKLSEDVKVHKEKAEEDKKAIKVLEDQIRKLNQDIQNKNNRIKHLETKLGEAPEVVEETKMEYVVQDNSEEFAVKDAQIRDLEEQNKKLVAEVEKLKKELEKEKNQPKGDGKERIVMQDDPETLKQLEQALQVERELRAANAALQDALDEAEQECEKLRKQLEKLGAKVEKPKEKEVKKVKEVKGPSEDELADEKNAAVNKALKKERALHEKKVAEMQAVIDKLEKKLEKALKEIEELSDELANKSGVPKTKVVKQVGIPEEEHNALKAKCFELEKDNEKHEQEYALLEQKVQMLMDKLKEKFSDAEMGEILEKIKLAPAPLRVQRKKKAWERLYDDAQRRIEDMKARKERLEGLEKKSIRRMERLVANTRDASKVENLSRLHSAHQLTGQRFYGAMDSFSKAHPGEEGYDEEDSDEEHTMTDLEELTVRCFKDGVCPRCAFSALSTFRVGGRRAPAVSMAGFNNLSYAGPTGAQFARSVDISSFGTPWQNSPAGRDGSPPRGGQQFGMAGRNQAVSPPPWEMGAKGVAHARPRLGSRDQPRSGDGSPAGRSGSPFGDQRRAGGPFANSLGSPLGSGPSPGGMPFDAAFPMPAPPWRQSVDSGAPPPWRQESGATPGFGMSASLPAGNPFSMSGSLASVGSTGPPAQLAATLGPGSATLGSGSIGLRPLSGSATLGSGSAVLSPLSGSAVSAVLRSAAEVPSGAAADSAIPGRDSVSSVPPWRRPRSDSPPLPSTGQSPPPVLQHAATFSQTGLNDFDQHFQPAAAPALQHAATFSGNQAPMQSRGLGPVAPPPSGMGAPPPRQARGLAASPSNGRLGRAPGPAGPDWLPPPIPGRVPAVQTMPLDPIVRNMGVLKDPSARPALHTGAASSRDASPSVAVGQSGGFQRIAPSGVGSQFVAELSRPTSGPPQFAKPTRPVDPMGQMHQVDPGTMGGGGHGTTYVNLPAMQSQTVPSSRSVPNLPVAGAGRADWQSREVPWEPSAAAKKLAPKASKKPGLGFMVAPVASQESMARGGATGMRPPS